MRKTVALFIMVMLICLNFSGCTMFSSKPSYLKTQSDEIVRCFDEKDAESLKNLFCTNSQNYYDLDTEIQNAFDLYDGKSESYKINAKGGWAGGYDDGVCVDRHNSPTIENIKTCEEKEYNISYCVYQIYKDDGGREGIGVIGLYDKEWNLLAGIGGYGWE